MKMRTLKRKRAAYSRRDRWWYPTLGAYPWTIPDYVFTSLTRDGDYSASGLAHLADFLTGRVARLSTLFEAPYGAS